MAYSYARTAIGLFERPSSCMTIHTCRGLNLFEGNPLIRACYPHRLDGMGMLYTTLELH